MSALDLLQRLRSLDVSLSVEEGKLKVRADRGVLTADLQGELARHKESIVRLLGAAGGAPGTPAAPPLEPAPRTGATPLSAGQERLWRLVSRAPDTRAYNLPLAFRLSGPLRVEALERAVAEIVRRHESLRTTVEVSDGEARAVVRAPGDPRLEPAELAAATERDAATAILEEARRPFDLARGPLIRVRLLRRGPDEHVLTVVMHHIISDGWSFEVFLGELAALYAAFGAGQPSPLPPLPLQYGDYAVWQRRYLQGERLESLRRYWQRQLAGDVRGLALPREGRLDAPDDRGDRHSRRLPGRVRDDLEALAGRHNVTLFMGALAAFACALHHLTGQDDLIVCTPAACRDRPEVQGLIGYFNNVLALRVSVAGDPTFGELLSRVRGVTLGAHEHRDLPFQDVAALGNLTRTPLTRAMFALQTRPLRALELAGLDVRALPLDPGTANFDLAVSLEPRGDDVEAILTRRAGVLGAAAAEDLLEHLGRLLEAVVDDPGRRLSDLLPGPASRDAGRGHRGPGRPGNDGAPPESPRLARPGEEEAPPPDGPRPALPGEEEAPSSDGPRPARPGEEEAPPSDGPRPARPGEEEVPPPDGSRPAPAPSTACPPAPDALPFDESSYSTRDPLEIQLTLIWQDVLGVEPIGPDDGFFELGGHSLLAVRLLERIEEELGRALPLATLFEASTVGALTRRLRDEGWEPPAASLVSMSPDGSRPPVFLIHSFEGHLFFYNELARTLGADQPVYGLQAVGVSGQERPLSDVGEMAQHYLDCMRTVQPDGPCVLVAMCFGIAPGLEIARRLRAAGEGVELVVIDSSFETLRGSGEPPAQPALPVRAVRRLRAHARGLVERARRAWIYLRASPYVRRERRVRAAAVRAWYSYRPRPYAGPLTLIRSADSAANPDRDWQVETLSELTGGALRIAMVPGHHFTILREPNVEVLAEHLRACVDRLEEVGSRPPG